MPRAKKTAQFEDSLGRLEAIVDQLESGEQSLEDSLKLFEEGVTLTRHCRQALDSAEQKVKQLVNIDDTSELEDFTSE